MKSTYGYLFACMVLYSCTGIGSQKGWVQDDDSDSSGELRPLLEGPGSLSVAGDITGRFEVDHTYVAPDEGNQPLVASIPSARPTKEASLQYWARKSIAPIGAVASAISNLFTPGRPDLAILMQATKSGVAKQHALDEYLDACIGKGDIEGLHIALKYIKENPEEVVILPQLKEKLITTLTGQEKLEYWRLRKMTSEWEQTKLEIDNSYLTVINQQNQKIFDLKSAITFIDPTITVLSAQEMTQVTESTHSGL